MASATASPPSTSLSDAQAMSLRRAAQIAAGVLLLLAAAKVVTSVLTFLSATLLALLGLVEGGLLVLLALVLIKIATDLRYAREAPQLANTHLLNALDSWQDFCKFLIGLAVVFFLEMALRFAS
jgi:energy-converting hydrogenase Eha subunit B